MRYTCICLALLTGCNGNSNAGSDAPPIQTQCGNCVCSWTCGATAYVVTCDEKGAAGMDCTCTADQTTVKTCNTAIHGIDVCSTQQCCGFPL